MNSQNFPNIFQLERFQFCDTARTSLLCYCFYQAEIGRYEVWQKLKLESHFMLLRHFRNVEWRYKNDRLSHWKWHRIDRSSFIHQPHPFSKPIMLFLKLMLSLFLIHYVFAAPVSTQDLGADKPSIGLPSSLDEKTSETSEK